MKPKFIVALSLAISTLSTFARTPKAEHPKEPFLYCGMKYDQDTTQLKNKPSDSTMLRKEPMRVHQHKKNLPIKEAKPAPVKRED